ncbi:hypothetical protein P9112_011565 [Eukaryota sp. TZLM1-RC]
MLVIVPNVPYRDSRINTNDPEVIPPTEMSKGHPPFFGPSFETELGITPRIGPYLPFERIEPENAKIDPEHSSEPRSGVRYLKTTREGVFTRFVEDEDNLFINEANPCPFPMFSPKCNASLDIIIDRDHRTGWWKDSFFIIDGLITLLPSVVEGRIKKTRLVQPAVFAHQTPAQFEDVQESSQSQPQLSEVPASPAQPAESPLPSMETDSLPTRETSNQSAMEQADDNVVTVSSESPTPITSSDAVPAPITPVSRAPQSQPTPSTTGSTSSISSHQSPFSGTYESRLLLSSMIGSRDRDDRRRDRAKRPYLEASNLSDADKLLKFVNKFILWRRTDQVLKETRKNVEDPVQIALANEVARLREELEQAREGSQPSIDEYFGNISGEPVHEWDLFRQAMRINPRGLAECVTPEVLNALSYQGAHLAISSPTVPTPKDERIIWA